MSDARDAIGSLADLASFFQRRPRLPQEAGTTAAVRALAAQDVPRAPEMDKVGPLRRQLKALAAERRGFASLSHKEMRLVPWLLWTQDDPLAALPGLLPEVLDRAAERKSVLRALLEAWLAFFHAGMTALREAAAGLRRLIAASDVPALEVWRRADARFRMFDPSGPERLAKLLVEDEGEVSASLADFGLGDPLRAAGGYMRAVQDEMLSLAAERMVRADGSRVLERICDFLVVDGRLRFPERAGAMAQALLRPWLNGHRTPPEDRRTAVQEFLLSHLGDPRLQPGRWAGVGGEAIALMRRWLTKASMDVFFGLIGQHAESHWGHREAFWGAYLQKGAIDDAWLAFSPSVYAGARSIKELRGAFGKVQGPGVQPGHSVLLIRVGTTIFCEWSHNGSLRAWPTDWKNAPTLAQALYERPALMGKCLPFPPNRSGRGGNADGRGLSHIGSDRDYWQESVAELIWRRERIRLHPEDWHPR